PDREQGRGVYNFTLFNLNYIPSTLFEESDQGRDIKLPGKLTLTPFEEKLGVKVVRTKDEKRYELARDFYTVDQIVYDIYNRFSLRTFEALHFDFGSVVVDDRYPEEDEIRQVILAAMEEYGIKGNNLSEENRKQIDLYFSQFLPRGKKKRVFENIEGDINPVDTLRMDRTGIRVSELERDRTAFLSEDYESEAGDTNKFVLDFISELRGRPEDKQQLSLFQPDDFVESRDEIIRPFVKGDTRPPFVVNTSKLKSPQNIVLVSYSPEKEFVFQLIEDSDYIDSWIKSPDKNFYFIDYEYWKGGKDRVRRSFNPDFFIKIDLDDYISMLESEGKEDHLEKLRKLQDEGIETLIKVVEIKSDEEHDEATPAKEEYAKVHFERVNKKLSTLNLADIDSQYRADARQYYTFDLLTPNQFQGWISDLKKGKLGERHVVKSQLNMLRPVEYPVGSAQRGIPLGKHLTG
ncbi:MAG: hypothetical protein ISS41_10555, partial [Candidatus Aminicenantes bacterium]|nr:hypothetical protein [Candidatus Aminicenantes bacterium]